MPADAPTDAQVTKDVSTILRAIVPSTWEVAVGKPSWTGPDLVLQITTPDGERADFVVEMKRDLAGSQLRTALEQLDRYVAASPGSRPAVAAPWIGPTVRERLAAEGISYI